MKVSRCWLLAICWLAEKVVFLFNWQESVIMLCYAGHCWVLADNEKLEPPAVLDSRVFGPLPAKLICGRILYYGRPLDHGPVHNSPQATSEDAPVLASELDVDKLTSVATDELQAH